ncbi:MAG: ribosome biogenesis GTPase Der [Deltaproteobacteria bacterium]|nr:ribosome biogenesis GTPase Der [Deltaproteobacteria bacterium]
MKSRRHDQPLGDPAEPPGPAPVVAVVGRPNVGKSTLVNRLCRKRVAIVANQSGMTRDRVYAETTLRNVPVVLVDTGGFDLDPNQPLLKSIRSQLFIAIEEADVIVCLFDGAASPNMLDEEIVGYLRRSGKKVIYAANKTEKKIATQAAVEFHELGIEDIHMISAAHGQGIGKLLDAVVSLLPAPEKGDAPGPKGIKLAVMGRPNAGKSTLVNTLLDEERMIVDDKPGTTRDAVQLPVTFMGHPYVLIDTAGMRRKRSIHEAVEELSVLHAVKAMRLADVVLLLIDAAGTIAEQDLRIANLALRMGCGLIVGVNKWDALGEKPDTLSFARPYTDAGTLDFVPVVRLSGLKAWNLEEVFEAVNRTWGNLKRRISTGEINRFLEQAVAAHQPPAFRHRPVRLNYATQVETKPPTFIIFTNHPEALADSYRRFLENRLREIYDFTGVPIRLFFRRKSKRRERRS